MRIGIFKAVIFDLFETLITEWGHEKYTKRQMCADLGVDKDRFNVFWKEKEEDRYIDLCYKQKNKSKNIVFREY